MHVKYEIKLTKVQRPTEHIIITHYLPSKALRSSNTNLLARPSGITSNFTFPAFYASAPSTWNSLPTHSLRSLDKLSTFKHQVMSHLFQSAFAV